MLLIMNSSIETDEASGIRAILPQPVPFPFSNISTAIITNDFPSAPLPLFPAFFPPTKVSSTSTIPFV